MDKVVSKSYLAMYRSDQWRCHVRRPVQLVFVMLALVLGSCMILLCQQVAAEVTPDTSLNVRVFGGRVGTSRIHGDHLIVATGATVQFVAQADGMIRASYDLPAHILDLAVAGDYVALVLANSEVHLLQVSRPVLRVIRHRQFAIDGDVVDLSLDASTLAIAVNSGLILVYRLDSDPLGGSVRTLRVSELLIGSWWVMALSAHDEKIYAVAYKQGSSDGTALISVSREMSGELVGQVVAVIEGALQPRSVGVGDRSAFILTQSAILAVDLASGGVFELPSVTEDPTSILTAMALSEDELFVLIQTETFTSTNSNLLVSFDVGDVAEVRHLSTVVVAPREESLRLDARDDAIVLAGWDSVTWYQTMDGVISQSARGSFVTIAVDAAVQSNGTRAIVARRFGLCSVDVVSRAQEWCSDVERSLRGVRSSSQGFVGFGPDSLVSFSLTGELLDIWKVTQGIEDSERFLAVEPFADGFVVLTDINPIRNDKTKYRVDYVDVLTNGTLEVTSSSTIEVEACTVRAMAVDGAWMGIGCDERLLELDLGGGGASVTGFLEFESIVTSVDGSALGLLAIGTRRGIVVMDRHAQSSPAILVEQTQETDSVLDLVIADTCVLAIQGGRTSEYWRAVRYCRDEDDSMIGTDVTRYWRPPLDHDNPSIEASSDGSIWIVTGYGQLLYVSKAESSSLIYLPVARAD